MASLLGESVTLTVRSASFTEIFSQTFIVVAGSEISGQAISTGGTAGTISLNVGDNDFTISYSGGSASGDDLIFELSSVADESVAAILAASQVTALGFTSGFNSAALPTFSGTSGGTVATTFSFLASAGVNLSQSVQLTLNEAPVIANLHNDAVAWSEDLPDRVALDAGLDALVTDDGANFNGGSLKVSFDDFGLPEDQLFVDSIGLVSVSVGKVVSFNGDAVGNVSGGANGSDLIVNFNTAAATANAVTAVLRSIRYDNTGGENPNSGNINAFVTVNDGSVNSAAAKVVVAVSRTDDPAVARNDAFTLNENAGLTGSLFADNGSGIDSDPDDDPLITAINGATTAVGQTITLASGALLLVNANGTFSYNPNGQFGYLAGAASGAVSRTATDSFTYTVSGGSTAKVVVNLNGIDSDGDVLIGTAGVNTLNGGIGTDTMIGGNASDTYLADVASDFIVETNASLATGGNDLVNYSGTGTFTLAANVERLTLTHLTAAVNGTGNELVNIITGNANANVLNGLGGSDTQNGGGGNDVFLIASQAELPATEIINGGTGTDRIRFTAAIASTLTLSNKVTLVEIAEIANAAGVSTGTAALNINAAAVTTGMTLIGNNGTNTLVGTGQADNLDGRLGGDTLSGGLGTDTQTGGDGNDVFLIAAPAEHTSTETINGGTGTDRIRFTATTAGTLTLSNKVTQVEVAEITNAAGLATGIAALNINAAAVTTAMTLIGNNGANVLTGTAKADVLDGRVGTDTLNGGLDNDVFLIAAPTEHTATEIMNGGTGTDRIRFTATAGTLTLSNKVTQVEVAEITNAAGLATGIAALNINAAAVTTAMTLIGNNGANVLTGTAKADVLDGRIGTDTLNGGLDNDIFLIAAPAEHTATEIMNGGTGTDRIRFTATAAGTLTLSNKVTQVEVAEITNAAGLATGIAALNINAAAVTTAMTLIGNNGANTLIGTAQNDVITGNAGVDAQFGNAGNDVFLIASPTEHTAAETINGGAGTADRIRFTATAASTLTLSNKVTQVEIAEITNAAGVATGIAALNINAAAVTTGMTLIGNNGANTLVGTAKADTLLGKAGRDVLAGGADKDLFRFDAVGDSGTAASTRDVITDFVKGVDRIQLNVIDARANTTAVNDAFTLLGKGTAGSAVLLGQIGWFQEGAGATAKTILRINNNLDSAIETTIEIKGHIALAITDFIL